MKKASDHFSTQAKIYAKFRPTYPKELYDWLLSLINEKQLAWDCGTGNGQVAVVLANHFEQVLATDSSRKQIDNAQPRPNIQYAVAQSESISLENESCDLITVGQALHWFDFETFFKEVTRVLKPDGIFAGWGYGLVRISPEINPLLDHYYQNIIGPYWPPERAHVDQHYASIPFPFENILPPKPFYITTKWTLDHFEGYLNTWSSLQRYLKVHHHNPVPELITKIREAGYWKEELSVKFPIFSLVGRPK